MSVSVLVNEGAPRSHGHPVEPLTIFFFEKKAIFSVQNKHYTYSDQNLYLLLLNTTAFSSVPLRAGPYSLKVFNTLKTFKGYHENRLHYRTVDFKVMT